MALLLAALFVACAALWVGVPLLWLYLGSMVQAATDNVGAAIGAMILGVTVSIGMMLPVLAWITRAYQRARVARGRDDTGAFPLEVAMTCAAMLAIAFVAIWFMFGGGAQPFIYTE
jgi:heme/copper-type cytochrome/quinol oxidase subunit 2